MYKLYHYPICPLSRQIRIILKELDLPFELIKEDYWQRRPEFLNINPAGVVPVLNIDDLNLVGTYSIIEYFNEKYPNLGFMTHDLKGKCEVRRLLYWWNDKFYREITKIIVEEKIINFFYSKPPRTDFVRIAKSNLTKHLNYFSKILERDSFMAGEHITYVDIAASSHISVLDYFGEFNWDSYSALRQWYSILKSRPSFRPILRDIVPGFEPSHVYADLDF